MHYALTTLYSKLEELGNVLTGRVQVAIGDIRNQCKCSVKIITDEITQTNKIEEKSHHYSGFLVTTENKIENESAIFLVVPVYRNRVIIDYFEFGFSKRMLFGSYMKSSGDYLFERKEIKRIDIRLVEPAPTGYVDPKILDKRPDFIITEAVDTLKNKLAAYFNNEKAISIYLNTNLHDTAIAITLTEGYNLPIEKLKDILNQDELSKNLMGYKLTQVLVRSEATNKISYVADLY